MPFAALQLAAASDYAPIGILLLIAITFGLINLGVPALAMKFFGHSRTGAIKEKTYETGMDPFHSARRRFNVRFYILAMTFLVFDVEIVFLYPWATVFASLKQGDPMQFQVLARMLFFIGTSIIAFVYAWRKGVFRYD